MPLLLLHRVTLPLPGLLLSALLLGACATPEAATPMDAEREGTPGSDDVEVRPDIAPYAEEEATGDQQRGPDLEGEPLTDADLTSRLSELGTHVVDGQGRTLYVFTADRDGERTCTGACLQTWPVFSTGIETPTVDGEVREELVGTIAGEDGGRQVTYNDQPLYYYVGDDEVGDLTGQGLDGQWFVVSAEGRPITEEAG
jgi:predicted lipoprotein with Yx(FWY)xxD motif